VGGSVAARFASLNPYDAKHVPGSILKVEKVNFDSSGRPRDLFGFAVSAKRYVLYERTKSGVRVVDPKAHGLGYLYPPVQHQEGQEPWTSEAWTWMLEQRLGLRPTPPNWIHLPAMMRVVLSTPFVLDRLNRETRPYNFLFCPLVDAVVGYPRGVDRDRFTLIAPFSKDRDRWLTLPCVNACDGAEFELALQQDIGGTKVVPQTFGYVLRLYPLHAESKSLAPDGMPCNERTVGLLQRATITAGHLHFVGKETDRRWEHGENLSVLSFKVMEYRAAGATAVADRALRARIAACGMRPTMRRTGLSQHTIEAVLSGRRVRRATLSRLVVALEGR
jgi:hypothetical protein